MNRKNLTAAVLAGLAGAAGIVGSAQAVNINPDGIGQVRGRCKAARNGLGLDQGWGQEPRKGILTWGAVTKVGAGQSQPCGSG